MAKEYKKIDRIRGNLDEVMQTLYQFNRDGAPSSYRFGIHELNSDMSIDDAYMEVVGMSKSEYDDAVKDAKIREEEAKRRQDAIGAEILRVFPQKGREVLDEKYLDRWDETVRDTATSSSYHGTELGTTLAIIKELNETGNMEKARELLYSERNSIMWSTTILAKVSFLCDRGNEFSNYVQLVNAKRDEQEMLRQGLVKPDTIFQELLINSPYVVDADKMNAWIKALQQSYHRGTELDCLAGGFNVAQMLSEGYSFNVVESFVNEIYKGSESEIIAIAAKLNNKSEEFQEYFVEKDMELKRQDLKDEQETGEIIGQEIG